MFDLIFGILAVWLCRVLCARLLSGWQVWQIKHWCRVNRWTDLFVQDSQYFAFPPHAVIPLPLSLKEIPRTGKGIKVCKLIQASLMALVPPVILGSLLVTVLTITMTLSLWLIKILVGLYDLGWGSVIDKCFVL